jgi:molybdopterin-guanine dinucleotide biosynthesis adapter protein
VSAINFKLPVLGFAAYSGTGKTTLLTQLIPILREKGLRIAMIKHAHHRFDVDKPGKDSYELRKAGASQMLICSSRRFALMSDLEEEREPELPEYLERLDTDKADLVLVEGFKNVAFPKIELNRPELGKDLIFPNDENIIAVGTDSAEEIDTQLPVLPLNEPQVIAEFILNWIEQNRMEHQ